MLLSVQWATTRTLLSAAHAAALADSQSQHAAILESYKGLPVKHDLWF